MRVMREGLPDCRGVRSGLGGRQWHHHVPLTAEKSHGRREPGSAESMGLLRSPDMANDFTFALTFIR